MTPLLRPLRPAAALLALAAGLTGCSSGGEAETALGAAAAPSSATVAGPAPVLASATTTDDVDTAAGTWSTTWEACFEPLPGEEDLERWEVQTLTSEGTSPQIEQLDDGCIELQVAQGIGTTPGDDPARLAALSDAARLTYQVRGVRADGSVTPWSASVAAGSVG
ncbi:hypothetical protein [Geodermatophilus obscurus]|uniref:Lipoprotein n=1 Tax=Geodermatophilus obscurus (strain ATCC 25078 / DSM 43160 / JCM 3152 / CCUG 61914 / KCC A-0152 / KCTC 9177 / NBRC 13315 / NRRL B-3577 / G-20) TaxID=526225 RepID=D2S8U2_GEOOG|nr:hypothetical protein [Geodermatophilus obscurus]ADB75673.1 conserved hypothetical protein [Geodermatophilus obscurus DSM 43160]